MALLRQVVSLSAPEPRLDLLVQRMAAVSRAEVRGLFDWECVKVDGVVATQPGLALHAGQRIEVCWEAGRRYKEKPRDRAQREFTIAFEDRHLIVVVKRAGVLSVPTDHGEDNTLVHAVARHLSKGQRITHKAFLVHRLDRDTSGLVVFGKTEAVAKALMDQFASRKPERAYIAIVAGQVREPRGTFQSFLATDEDLDQFSTRKDGEGKLAITHFQVLQRLRGATVVEVRLETGRRNQIRVHFSEHGHPVLGDIRYKKDEARHPGWTERRLALHARTLGFAHPVTGQMLRLVAEPPPGFAQFVRSQALPAA
jgi:23S rRNA pseudouridine1911/1915/1917 synthase